MSILWKYHHELSAPSRIPDQLNATIYSFYHYSESSCPWQNSWSPRTMHFSLYWWWVPRHLIGHTWKKKIVYIQTRIHFQHLEKELKVKSQMILNNLVTNEAVLTLKSMSKEIWPLWYFYCFIKLYLLGFFFVLVVCSKLR